MPQQNPRVANGKIRVLVLGASGMLGNAVLRVFAGSPGYETFGTVRVASGRKLLPEALSAQIISGVDLEQTDRSVGLFAEVRPDLVVNCIGVVKQHAGAADPLNAIPVNSLLPHRLAQLCHLSGARLVHIGTDCVFAGTKGMYTEADVCDAKDLYGCSKYLGEVNYPHAITLRTSLIGHELSGARSLVCWFLSQQGCVKGFRRAVFSGLPAVELAKIIRDQIVPRPELRGVYHVSADPINKFELLTLIAKIYGKSIDIVPDDELVIDRSLDSSRFRRITSYQPPPWPELVSRMRDFS
jgi:dTDP-4-dehydrorhamnose reductase